MYDIYGLVSCIYVSFEGLFIEENFMFDIIYFWLKVMICEVIGFNLEFVIVILLDG